MKKALKWITAIVTGCAIPVNCLLSFCWIYFYLEKNEIHVLPHFNQHDLIYQFWLSNVRILLFASQVLLIPLFIKVVGKDKKEDMMDKIWKVSSVYLQRFTNQKNDNKKADLKTRVLIGFAFFLVITGLLYYSYITFPKKAIPNFIVLLVLFSVVSPFLMFKYEKYQNEILLSLCIFVVAWSVAFIHYAVNMEAKNFPVEKYRASFEYNGKIRGTDPSDYLVFYGNETVIMGNSKTGKLLYCPQDDISEFVLTPIEQPAKTSLKDSDYKL